MAIPWHNGGANERSRARLRQLAISLQHGQLTRSDVTALFILLRGSATKGSITRDIGDCVAHDVRDRGNLFSFANQFVRSVRRTIALAAASVLDGVKVEVRAPHVACRLSGGQQPAFAIDLLRGMPDGVLQIPSPKTLLFPMLRDYSLGGTDNNNGSSVG
ncbi:hypothetical protein M3G03_11165 [Aestuariimicrobium sp. p3-SID1156]|uniref:hypothetical protein n=1 Tax=Aestuariimicrobium sp. p3-SID1156 TaxID=2916038 RepID=UPI00223AEFE6|nr:hypothetical protein [Aestuariimicrobium sp. p3-SID1156]MCT1460087.1 hypothetical protein [Aestuariimicrobium sp. p3-SID1156]